jgi:putative membrane protein
MPSEQRLHPASLLFDLARHVKAFALPALLVVFGTARSSGGPGGTFGRLPSGWEVWLLVLFVPAAIVSIARYLSFRLRYDEHELVIRSGIIFRNERHVPYSRIQNVDAVENVVHRCFGVVEVHVQTGGGNEEEARLSVLPRAAFETMRQLVFQERPDRAVAADAGTTSAPTERDRGETLLHLPVRELLLCGFLENKGMVLIGALYGVLWETGLLNQAMGSLAGGGPVGRGFFRDVFRALFDGGPLPLGQVGIAVGGLCVLLLLVRLLSMLWAVLRLYDFRLTRSGEDLRTEYGLFTRVTATVPLRRVQAITVYAGPLHRWLRRATFKVATAGGTGGRSSRSADHTREWLAPLIRDEALPPLLQHVVPGFDLTAVRWQTLHPRAFARAIKPRLLLSTAVTGSSALALGWGALGVAILMLLWTVIGAKMYVAHVGWAETEDVVLMKSGWIWRQFTLARVNKIQAVATLESPFDRLAAMARVRVDTAGAGELSHRVDVPYLDRQVARGLAGRLSAAAANTAFRW